MEHCCLLENSTSGFQTEQKRISLRIRVSGCFFPVIYFFLLFLYLRGMSNNWKCHTVRLTLTSVQVQLSTRSICVEYIQNSTPSHRSGMTWLKMVYTVKCNMSNDAVIVPHVCNVLCYFVCFCFLDNLIRKFH